MSAVAEPPAQTMGSAVPSSAGEINASTLMPAATSSANVPAGRIAAATSKLAPSVRPPAMGDQPATQVFDDGKKSSERLFENLNKLARDPNAPREDKRKLAAKPTEPVEAQAEDGNVDDLTGAEAAAKPGEAAPEALAATSDKKKVNPWKLADEHKAARSKAEAEVVELRKLVANPEARKQEVERMASIEKRNQELEETIKFVDYSKSKDFTEKYQKPYEAAWGRAMAELKELTITDGNGERPMAPSDLLDLVNMPLMKAREVADELYGASSNEVMAYRKEIRTLYDQQAQALDEARKSGVEKSNQDQTQRTEQFKAIQAETNQHWENINKAIIENPQTGVFFKPVEGDQEINTRLEAGYKFVDETMAVNPLNPNLTPQQRQESVKRHASLRHRAAAFGRMRLESERTQKALKAVLAKLEQYEKSTPTFGGDSREASTPQESSDKMAGMLARLTQRAK